MAMTCVLALAARADAQRGSPSSGPIAHAAARFAAEAAAQQPAPDTAWLSGMALLSTGDDVRGTLGDGTHIRGTFVAADADSMTLEVNGSTRRVTREEVRRVAVAKGTRYRRHVNIGMAVGGVIGAILLQRHCRGESASSPCYEETMLYFGGPMLAGGAIGHLLPRGVAWRETYVRPVRR
jgi:hypothetical protein